MSSVRPVNYYTYNNSSDIQKQKADSSQSGVNSAANKKSVTDILELSSETRNTFSVDDQKTLTNLQPQLSNSAPVNKSQTTFKSILESKKALSADELLTSLNEKKNAAATKENNSASAANQSASQNGGYILTIPSEHIEDLKTYRSNTQLRDKLYNLFNAQDFQTGSLVNVTL